MSLCKLLNVALQNAELVPLYGPFARCGFHFAWSAARGLVYLLTPISLKVQTAQNGFHWKMSTRSEGGPLGLLAKCRTAAAVGSRTVALYFCLVLADSLATTQKCHVGRPGQYVGVARSLEEPPYLEANAFGLTQVQLILSPFLDI